MFKYKGQLYLERRMNANGPDCAVWPPQLLRVGITADELSVQIDRALVDYKELGRSIEPTEWKERGNQAIRFFNEKSEQSFRRKKKEITVRQNTRTADFSLFDGNTGAVLAEARSSKEVAEKILDLFASR